MTADHHPTGHARRGLSAGFGVTERAAIAALTLVAFALRAHRLAAQSLWSDEDITLDRAGLPLREMLESLPAEHGPLYFALMRPWTLAAGAGDLALRFPSLACGVLAVPLAAFVGARLAGRRAGLVAALVAAVNPFLVWYGQEARMYTLLAALALAALAAASRADGSGGRRWWAATGALAALAVYTHYFGALLLAVLAAWAILDVARGRGALGGWLTAGAVAAGLFLPWLPRAISVLGFPGWRDPEPLAAMPWTNLAAWSANRGPGFPATASAGQARAATWLYVALALVGLATWVRLARRPGADHGPVRALLYVAAPLAAIALLVTRTTDFHPRYFFAVVPAFYLAAAAGVATLPRPAAWLAVAGLVASAAVPLANLHTDPTYQKQDYRGFVGVVEAAAGYEDTVLFLDGPAYGLTRRYEIPRSPVKIVNLQSSGQLALGGAALEARVAELAGEYPHLWLATNGGATGQARRWLDERAYPVEDHAFQDIRLARYFHPTPDPLLRQPEREGDIAGTGAPVPDDGGRVALGVAAAGEVAAGGIMAVRLVWRPLAVLDGEHRVSVRLVDAGGAVAASADRRPGNWSRPTSGWAVGGSVLDLHGLAVPPGLPTGAYALHVVLYDERTLEPVFTWNTGSVRVTAP